MYAAQGVLGALVNRGRTGRGRRVEETQISASNRRCFRIADGDKLVGGCAEMPRALMAGRIAPAGLGSCPDSRAWKTAICSAAASP